MASWAPSPARFTIEMAGLDVVVNVTPDYGIHFVDAFTGQVYVGGMWWYGDPTDYEAIKAALLRQHQR